MKKVVKKKKPVTKTFPKPKKVARVQRELPKGVSNDEARKTERPRRKDGTFVPDSSLKDKKTVSAADKHLQNFDLKMVFLETFKVLGGVEELANWAAYSNANQTEFYKMLARMLPREMSVTGGDIEPNSLAGLEDKELDAIIARHSQRK